jgi:myxalamid-type polyketide synthase MxaE and MxaD
VNPAHYKIIFRRAELAPAKDPPSQWILFAEQAEHALPLAAALEAQRCLVCHVTPAELAKGADLVLSRLAPDRRLGVVSLVGLHAPSSTLELDVPTQAARALSQTRTLIQSLVRERRPPARLWILTRGATVVTPHDARAAVHPWASALWGMGRVVDREHPELACTLIDMPSTEAPDRADGLATLLAKSEGEREIALRDGSAWVSRLVHREAEPEAPPSRPIRPDATYLITGGLGALGLAWAKQLVQSGCRHLALVARRPRDLRPDVEPSLRALESAGARVRVITADVSDTDDLRRALREINDLPPLKGVFHAAGVLDDHLLMELTDESLTQVLAPKIRGAWSLHERTLAMDLDHFVLWSSASGIFGTIGQAAYAAANTFLDGLSEHRHTLGLPSISVQWGAFSGGLAAKGDRVRDYGGIHEMTPDQGAETLSRLLGIGDACVCVHRVDWTSFFASFPQSRSIGLFMDLSGANAPAGLSRVLTDVLAKTGASRAQAIQAYLADRFASITRIPPDRISAGRPIIEYGINSLMATELKLAVERDLGVALSLTRLLGGDALRELAMTITDAIARAEPPEVKDGSDPTRDDSYEEGEI